MGQSRLTQKVLEGSRDSDWNFARGHLCPSGQELAFCLCPKNLNEAEIKKNSGLISLLEEISKQIVFKLWWLQLTIPIECVKQKYMRTLSSLRGK